MKLATIIVTATLTVAPGIAAAQCMWGDTTAQISCAEGQVYDSEARTCVPVTTS